MYQDKIMPREEVQAVLYTMISAGLNVNAKLIDEHDRGQREYIQELEDEIEALLGFENADV